MPIPLLFIGLGAGAAALGIGKSAKAVKDQKDAHDTNEYARDIVEGAKTDLEKARKASCDALTYLGEQKISILENGISPFIELFEQIHNVEITDSVGLNELSHFRVDKQSLGQLKEMQIMASSVAGGMASGAALGAVTAFGAYGAAMTFGAASTGTAIATLSGAAATNATLAFLGGGSLAAGGLGIAGGTAVLGGLVAGPALAVMGFVVGAKASANKEKAYSNLAEAKQFREESLTAQVACSGIRRRAEMFSRVLLKLSAAFDPLVYSLEKIIATTGTDYFAYSEEQQKTVAASMAMAGAIKSILDTPILTDDGSLTPQSLKAAESVNKMLRKHNG